MTTSIDPKKKHIRDNEALKLIGIATGIYLVGVILSILLDLRYLIKNFDIGKKKKALLSRYQITLLIIILSLISMNIVFFIYFKFNVVDIIYDEVATAALDNFRDLNINISNSFFKLSLFGYGILINAALYYVISRNMEIIVNTKKFKKVFVDFDQYSEERRKKFLWTHVGVMMDTDKHTPETIASNEAMWSQLNITIGKPIHSDAHKSICLFRSGQSLADFYIYDDPEKEKEPELNT